MHTPTLTRTNAHAHTHTQTHTHKYTETDREREGGLRGREGWGREEGWRRTHIGIFKH
jgi:hypothetical protein